MARFCQTFTLYIRLWYLIISNFALCILCLIFYSIVQAFVYIGLSFSTSSLGIDPYLSFVIIGAVEIPAYLSCVFVAEWFGRKGATFGTLVLSGICCCVTPLVREFMWYYTWITLVKQSLLESLSIWWKVATNECNRLLKGKLKPKFSFDMLQKTYCDWLFW